MMKKELLNTQSINIILNQLACQLIENHSSFSNTVLVGLQPRGINVARRLLQKLKEKGIANPDYGQLDITFYRDDFRRKDSLLHVNQTVIDVSIENRKVVFIDDVLFTGRSVRAALDAILSFGRPSSVELLVLIDRRFSQELPIRATYSGKRVDSITSERVLVKWKEENKKDCVYLIKPENE